ncbi:hypothetical protein L9F63_021317, partial [Diploptera punctata]
HVACTVQLGGATIISGSCYFAIEILPSRRVSSIDNFIIHTTFRLTIVLNATFFVLHIAGFSTLPGVYWKLQANITAVCCRLPVPNLQSLRSWASSMLSPLACITVFMFSFHVNLVASAIAHLPFLKLTMILSKIFLRYHIHVGNFVRIFGFLNPFLHCLSAKVKYSPESTVMTRYSLLTLRIDAMVVT